jgi:hypothetical protein
MTMAKKVLRYLQGRKSIPLRWCACSCQQPHLPGHIYGYADASFAVIDFRASMGYVFIINNGAVSWRSTRPPLVTLSAAESESIALSPATQEAVYLCKLANELGFTLLKHHPLPSMRIAPLPLPSPKRNVSATGPNISPSAGPSSLNDSTPPLATFKSSLSAAK